MKGDAQAILAVAASIADGHDPKHIDWHTLEAAAASDEERKLVRSLRLIASIGELHRSTENEENEPDNATAFLAHRAKIVGRIGPATASFGGVRADNPARRA